MAGLLDIAPPEIMARTFEIRGGKLTVRAIMNKEWLALLNRFSEIKKLIDGEAMNVTELYQSAEGLVPAIIATGLGNCGDEETEKLIVDKLSEAEQFAILEAILEIGAAEKTEARKKVNPLLQSPETGNPPNGSLTNQEQIVSPNLQLPSS